MAKGSSGIGGGEISGLARLAATESNPNKVLNSVDNEKLGSTFNALSAGDRASIKGFLALRTNDVNHLASSPTNTVSQQFRLDGKLYTVEIGTQNGNVVYSLRKGRKNIVNKGSYANAANQMALLF